MLYNGYPQSTSADVANPNNAYFRLASSNLCRNWEAESPATDSKGGPGFASDEAPTHRLVMPYRWCPPNVKHDITNNGTPMEPMV